MTRFARWIAVVCILIHAASIRAEENATSETVTAPSLSRFDRPWKVSGIFSGLDLLIPGKFGLSFERYVSEVQSFEVEFLRGSVSTPWFIPDVGAMSESRLALQTRRHIGASSFIFIAGLAYSRFSARLGSDLLTSVSGGDIQKLELAELDSLNLNIGIGNHWVFANGIGVGIDWASLSQPVIKLRRSAPFTESSGSTGARDDVDLALKLAQYLPRFSILKAQVSYSF